MIVCFFQFLHENIKVCVLIVYVHKPPLNVHADLPSLTIVLNVRVLIFQSIL